MEYSSYSYSYSYSGHGLSAATVVTVFKDSSGSTCRVGSCIQGMNTTIVYNPGKNNVVPDALSKAIVVKITDLVREVCLVSVDMASNGVENFREEQMNGIDVKKIIDASEWDDSLEQVRWPDSGVTMWNLLDVQF